MFANYYLQKYFMFIYKKFLQFSQKIDILTIENHIKCMKKKLKERKK